MTYALLIWAVALTVLVIVGIVWVLDLQARLGRLQKDRERSRSVGADSANPVAAIDDLSARLAETTAHTERLTARIEQIEAALARAVQGLGLVRFRAFQDTGGDQSFALAMADGEGNGVVVSALYARDATRIYAKPVARWLSSKALGEEEEQALAEARQSIVGRN